MAELPLSPYGSSAETNGALLARLVKDPEDQIQTFQHLVSIYRGKEKRVLDTAVEAYILNLANLHTDLVRHIMKDASSRIRAALVKRMSDLPEDVAEALIQSGHSSIVKAVAETKSIGYASEETQVAWVQKARYFDYLFKACLSPGISLEALEIAATRIIRGRVQGADVPRSHLVPVQKVLVSRFGLEKALKILVNGRIDALLNALELAENTSEFDWVLETWKKRYLKVYAKLKEAVVENDPAARRLVQLLSTLMESEVLTTVIEKSVPELQTSLAQLRYRYSAPETMIGAFEPVRELFEKISAEGAALADRHDLLLRGSAEDIFREFKNSGPYTAEELTWAVEARHNLGQIFSVLHDRLIREFSKTPELAKHVGALLEVGLGVPAGLIHALTIDDAAELFPTATVFDYHHEEVADYLARMGNKARAADLLEYASKFKVPFAEIVALLNA